MRKVFTLLALAIGLQLSYAQDDVAVTQFLAPPSSGCGFTAFEDVTIELQNVGATDLSGMGMDLTYVINGTPFTDFGISFFPFNVGDIVSYTFSVPADLSVPGPYTFDALAVLNPPLVDADGSNNSISGYMVNSLAPSFGGTINPANSTGCVGLNSGTLTLSGETGVILDWEFSTDGGITWNSLGVTTSTYNYNNLMVTTDFRVLVEVPGCASDYSSFATVTMVNPPVGGTVSGSTTVCSGSNSGSLTLSGESGTILAWITSTTGPSGPWTLVANTTASQSYLNLTQTTYYGVIVSNSPCPDDTSTIAVITVLPSAVGGTVNSSATVCSSASGTLTLTGETGSVVEWLESTVSPTGPWTSIANTTTSHNYVNLTQTTHFTAVVSNGGCPADTAVVATITVAPPSAGGIVSATQTVCTGTNSGTLTLSGHSGSILNWEFSTDGGFSWTNIVNTTTSQTFTNLTSTTQYRAAVQNGSCPAVFSVPATVYVSPAAVGGSVTSNATVCAPVNTGNLTLAGHTGTVGRWEYSTDGGITWINITNTTTSYTYNNLTVTTRFRAFVQNGACSAFSSPAIITVTPASVGGTVSASATVCSGSNSGTLTLTGHTGSVLNWQFSTVSPAGPWTPIANVTTSQNYTNLTQTTYYSAVVSNGGCASSQSSVVTITVDPATVGGSVTSSAIVCSGVNSGTLNLAGHTGSVVRWEMSTDGGITWVAISNTTTSQFYQNLTVTTGYRAVIQSGVCAQVASSIATIAVDPLPVGGIVSADITECEIINFGSLTLSGQSGTIVGWVESTFGPTGPWTPIANTSTSQIYSGLTQTTYYAAVVSSGSCPNDTSSVATVTIDATTVPGILSANNTVCSGNNGDTLDLSGFLGNIQNWEYSIDGGVTWLPINSTNDSLIYSNLTVTTMYHVVVKNGVCSTAVSNNITITVDPGSVAGTIASNATVCSGTNSGTLTLSGNTGNVTEWLTSTVSPIGPWTSIANTTTSQTYLNLTQTTYYTAVVVSGVCSSDTAGVVTITVDPVTVAGTLAVSDTVCSGLNGDTLVLSGFAGNILGWEYSNDGGVTWLPISNTNDSLIYANLTNTVMYHAIVQSGVCNPATSNNVTITVDPVSVAGTIASGATVCSGANSGTLTLSGNTGSVTEWLMSTVSPTGPWTSIANTTNTENYLNLTQTTYYTAVVMSGVCSADTAGVVTIAVDPVTVAGTLSLSDTVCSGLNNDTLVLSGFVGNILSWEYSTDGGFTWIAISNTNDSLIYNNLTMTTMYHVVVQSGVCASSTSNNITITVDPASVAGTIASSMTVCSGNNAGTLTLFGNTGNVTEWLSSTVSPVGPWTSIPNTTTIEPYSNITQTTYYTAVVMSGSCLPDTAAVVTITVDPQTVGGVVSTADTVCAGSNLDTLFLTGQVGSILGWEYSTDGGITWFPISNTDDSLIYSNLTTTTMYHAVVQSGVCNSDTSGSVTITVNPTSVGGTVNSSTSVCEGSNSGTLTLTGQMGSVLEWLMSTTSSTGPWTSIPNTTTSENYSNLVLTTYYTAVVQSGGCTPDTAVVATITVDPKPVASFTATSDTICFGTTITFNNTSTIASGFIQSYMWDFGDNNSVGNITPVSHTYASAGTYTVTLITVSNNGCLDTSTLVIQVNTTPSAVITASGPLSFCNGDSITLNAPSGINLSYLWNPPGNTTQSIVVDSSAIYVVLVTDTITGCSATDSVEVVVFPSPVVDAGNDTTISLGASVTLNGTGSGSFNWMPTTVSNPFIEDPVASPTVTTTYTFTVTDANGCVASDTVRITVEVDYVVTVMNLLTPNGDGFNDTWVIDGILLYPSNTVAIYNRNGQEVYSKEGYDNTWTGTFDGQQLPDGTYYYVLTFTDTDKVYKGAVTVMREK